MAEWHHPAVDALIRSWVTDLREKQYRMGELEKLVEEAASRCSNQDVRRRSVVKPPDRKKRNSCKS